MEKFLIKKPRFSERAEESSSEKSSNEELAKNTTPPKKQKRYTQKYKSEWESSRNWLKELDKQAYCKLCHKSLSNNIYNLNRHALSFKHQQAAQNTCKQICLDECLQNTAPGEVQKIRNTLMVVAYCVQHSHPFTSMDTLPLLIHTLSPSDKPIKCGSTKATEIVNTILGPYAMNEIAKELREKHFSLIIDEGTDISMTKCLTVIVRYIPKGKSVVIDRFFGLVQPADGKAQSLYEALKDKILSLNIPLSNAIGFATDNAFVMQGKNESVRKKIQENNKDIFYLGCTCHSLNLCSSAASKQLPPKLEKLVKNIYNFFSTSSNRQKEFKKFQEHFGTPCHKILGLSVTRWLSLEAVIERVIEQWVALRHFFLLFTYEELHETNASNILEELNDTNMTYFLFLNHILKKINALNKFYQSQGTLIHLLHIQMKTFFMQILQNFIKIEHISLATDYHNEIFHLPESEMFFGLKCTEFMQNDNIDADVIRKNLLKYYISLCDQIKLRFDFNDNKLKLLEYFDPKKIQDGKMPTITELLKAFPFHKVSDEVLNDEWRSLMAYDREKLNNIFKDDYVKGWIELGREKNILERLLFENLSKYMCSLAVLPHSSAAAERSFSIMKDLKSAKRNRLNLETELVAISPERRNWRGIFIALLVIAAVFSLIIFSIFLLSPEDEGLRIRGRPMELSDILGDSLQWKPFNGTWSNDFELIFRDSTGGLSIINLENYTTRTLMTNSTFRQLNAESFLVSPDQKYVLLQSDSNVEGSRNHVYEVQSANTFPLGPTENISEAPRLQYVIWAPIYTNTNSVPSTTTTVVSTTASLLLNSLATNGAGATGVGLGFAGGGGGTVANKQLPTNGNGASNRGFNQNQAIAFVYENDIYYKPKVQGELVCRITTTGRGGLIYNGIPDWTYSNVPEMYSTHNSIAFSTDGLYLAFLTFNDSEVEEYKYTWMGDDVKYPTVLKQRYPKAGTTNPNVTVSVVNLSVLKYIFPIRIKLPNELSNGSYIGALTWPSPVELSVTITNRAQTQATTILCHAPDFHCRSVHTEVTVNDGWLLPAERPIFSLRLNSAKKLQNQRLSNDTFRNVTNGQTTYEISNGGYLLKRLPVRDGEHGHFRHVVFISSLDRRPVPLTMGRFEVTEIIGWDETNEIVYFMAAPEKRPGERHLYKISLKLNVTKTNRTYITSTQPTCLTCDNTASTYKLRNLPTRQEMSSSNELNELTTLTEIKNETNGVENCAYKIPRNCLYNKIYFSKNYSFYVQECLGPESPSVYLVDTQSNMKIFVLNAGNDLRQQLDQLALPQLRTFSVEIRHGFNAQVRLFLPPGMREDEEVAFPLILHIDAAPGSQLVNEKFHVDWNWYLSSERSVIVAQIDGRGSGFQGELLRTQVHGKLGTVEVEDQLGVLTYLRDNLKFIDPSRVCAYGWGYGGYATTMALIDDSQQVLQCGVAINPIVSFGYHYSFFTERYIPLKGDYLRAMQEADLTMKAGNIKSRNLMLMHGTADTLVHQDHTLMLVRSLVDQQIKFRHQVYPDEDHGLTKSLSHVYKTMEWYFDECFGPNDDTEWDPTGLFVFKQ